MLKFSLGVLNKKQNLKNKESCEILCGNVAHENNLLAQVSWPIDLQFKLYFKNLLYFLC